MGIFKRSHHSIYLVDIPCNPNPKNFTLIETKRIGNYWISKVNYPDAKNYEGNKILLTTWNPEDRKEIDPHFTAGSGIIARFEPTKAGWQLAIKTAEYCGLL
jgi:hypothetical protein